MKYYTRKQIVSEFLKLNKDAKIMYLIDALDYMQAYNGRSQIMCIALAMGYDNDIGSQDTYYKRIEKSATEVK